MAAFVAELTADFRANGGTWENRELLSFLEAMGRWISDMERYYQNTSQELAALPPWRVFADILMAARVYE